MKFKHFILSSLTLLYCKIKYCSIWKDIFTMWVFCFTTFWLKTFFKRQKSENGEYTFWDRNSFFLVAKYTKMEKIKIYVDNNLSITKAISFPFRVYFVSMTIKSAFSFSSTGKCK